jgi:hypothetical protein
VRSRNWSSWRNKEHKYINTERTSDSHICVSMKNPMTA